MGLQGSGVDSPILPHAGVGARWLTTAVSEIEASQIQVRVEGGIGAITLDRPDKRNAMTLQMWQAVTAACDRLAHDTDVRTVLISGAGKSFCSGADVSALHQGDAAMKAVVAEAESALRELPVPTIALIHGHCWGGGMQLAVACDLRLATPDATFAVPPARLGVVYTPASLRTMIALIGPSATKRMLFSGDPLDAEAALRLGLVDELVPVSTSDPSAALAALLTRGEELAESFAPRSLLSQVAAKAVVNAVVDATGAEHVYDRYLALWGESADGAEGPAAFLERRSPTFTWHPASERSGAD